MKDEPASTRQSVLAGLALDARQRCLVAMEELKNHIRISLTNGLTVRQIEEATIEAVAYAVPLAALTLSKSNTFDPLDRWMAEHLKEDLRVDALAGRVHMSPRNFARVYSKKRGCTPAKAVEAIRVEAAKRRLEETEDRIESVAEQSGFSGEEQMRCAFIRILGIPPREYRKRLSQPP